MVTDRFLSLLELKPADPSEVIVAVPGFLSEIPASFRAVAHVEVRISWEFPYEQLGIKPEWNVWAESFRSLLEAYVPQEVKSILLLGDSMGIPVAMAGYPRSKQVGIIGTRVPYMGSVRTQVTDYIASVAANLDEARWQTMADKYRGLPDVEGTRYLFRHGGISNITDQVIIDFPGTLRIMPYEFDRLHGEPALDHLLRLRPDVVRISDVLDGLSSR